MAVYLLVFQYYQRIAVENYAIFLFCGLLPWMWVASGLSEGTSSVVASGHLITKSMFPAQVLPAVAILTSLINYLLSLPLLLLIMLISGVAIPATVVLLPVVVFIQCLFLFGIALVLSAMNVLFRDVQHVVGNALTFLFFLCPVLYDRATVPAKFQVTIDYNPLALLMESYHLLLLKGQLPSLWALEYVLAWTLGFLIFGSAIFYRARERFAEAL
jgi:lipopolysaccharide transport system permease protein